MTHARRRTPSLDAGGWGVPNPAGTHHHTPHGAAPERSVSMRDAQRLSGLGYAIPMASA